MCANELQEPAKVVQEPSKSDIAGIKLVIYASVVALAAGIMIGTVLIEPLAIAAVIGVLASWAVGIFVVAPRAGHIAKSKIMRTLSDPSPEEATMLSNLTMHVLGSASQIAQHDEAKKLYKPIVAACMETIDESIDKSMGNLASQASKGIGAFSEEDDGASMLKEFVSSAVFPTVDGMLDGVGASDSFKKKIHFKLMTKMSGFRPDGGQSFPSSGYTPSGGK